MKKEKCEGEDCDAETKEGADTLKKPDAVKDVEKLLKAK